MLVEEGRVVRIIKRRLMDRRILSLAFSHENSYLIVRHVLSHESAIARDGEGLITAVETALYYWMAALYARGLGGKCE